MKLPEKTIDSIQHLFSVTSSSEKRITYGDYPEKIKSKEISIGMFPPEVNTVLEIGGDKSSTEIMAKHGIKSTAFGLHIDGEQDMHTMDVDGKYDGVYARHVLEHSVFPALAMYNIHRAVRGGGWVIIVLPTPESEFCLNFPNHFSVMFKEQWVKIFTIVGFKLMDTVRREWADSHEYIFLLKK